MSTVGESQFPDEIDSYDSLLRLALGVQTRLLQPVLATDMEIVITDPALLSQPSGEVLIDTEFITYTSIVGQRLIVETRGAFQGEGGYPPADHVAGSRVIQDMTRSHHRVLAQAAILQQLKLGKGDSEPAADTYLVGIGVNESEWQEIPPLELLNEDDIVDALEGVLLLTDGVTAPATPTGRAVLYVDVADGDLKVKFSDGTVKTITVDT